MTFTLRFQSDSFGLLVLFTDNDQDQDFQLIPSYIPDDPIYNLLIILIRIASGQTEETIYWNTEPTKYALTFMKQNNMLSFTIQEHQKRNQNTQLITRFSTYALATDVLMTFWRALRRLESQVSIERPRQPSFPHHELHIFKHMLEQAGR